METTHSYMLISYSEILLNLLMSSSSGFCVCGGDVFFGNIPAFIYTKYTNIEPKESDCI